MSNVASYKHHKACKGPCRKVKPKAEFHRHCDTTDGLQPYCKACTAAYDRERYVKHGARNQART